MSSITPQGTSGAAIASLIFGILALFTFAVTSVPAIICGHVARAGIRKSEGRVAGSGMALAGLVLGYLTAVCGLALVAGMIWLLAPPSDELGTVSPLKVEKFADRAGLVIPATATATKYRRVFARDGQEYLKLEIPAGDLDEFLEKSGLEGELNNTSRTGGFTSMFGDFLSAHPKKFREGQKSLPRGEALNVLVDEDSPTTAVVYMCWFGT